MKRTIHNHESFVIGVAMTLFMSAAPSYAGGELDKYRNHNPTQAHELHRDNNHGPYVLPLGSKPFGQSYGEWAADFAR